MFWLLLLFLPLCAGPLEHLRPLKERTAGFGLEGVDFIYIINLDKRPERWEQCLQQLFPHGIFPQRFPAIHGWSLPLEVIHDIGLKFNRSMWSGNEQVLYFSEGGPLFTYLNPAFYGEAVFSPVITKGGIGCALSHLSVLQDAYEAGYETIWVLEDDLLVLDNPHKLSELIQELDSLLGKEGWDLLYTDFDYLVLDPNRSVASQFGMMWRPDRPFLDIEFLRDHRDLNDHFLKIGNRLRAHSILYRRCGIKKILDFYRKFDLFLPYDNELSLIPDIRFYVIKQNIVTVQETTSDTRGNH